MASEDDVPPSRPRPFLLLGAALALAVAIVVLLNTRLPGRSYTLIQEGKVRVLGHTGAVRMAKDCASCHR